MDDLYPDSPGVRAGSPDTSYQAADSVSDAAANREALALRMIREKGRYGATADEVADALGWERYSARPRLSMLRARGNIDDSGKRRRGVSGRFQVVWLADEYLPVPSSVAGGTP